MASGLRTRMLGAGTLVNVWEVMTVKSTQRHAVTVASLMGLMLAAAPLLAQPAQQPAQRGGPPHPARAFGQRALRRAEDEHQQHARGIRLQGRFGAERVGSDGARQAGPWR